MELSVSILGIKDEKEKIEELVMSNASYLHLDIMDGKFVENKVDMLDTYHKPLDVHLMVEDVASYVSRYEKLNPEYITFHIEALKNPETMIDYLHAHNIKVGISIRPETDISVVSPYLDRVDLVLVMSVNPGRGGQKFMEDVLPKIDWLYEVREKSQYHYKIEVDGGVNVENKNLLTKADILVVGSYITASTDYKVRIDEMMGE